MTFLLSSWKYIAGIVAAVVLYFAGRSGGKTAAVVSQAKTDTADANQRVEDMKSAETIKQAVASADDSDVDKQLLDKWTKG